MPKTIQLKLQTLLGLALAVVVGSFAVGYGARIYVANLGARLDVASIKEVESILKRKFDGTLDDAKLLDGAKAGLAAATGDPYTTYLNADAAKSLSDDLNGTLSGIGAEVGIRSNHLTVISPIADAPAAKAGIRSGDIIVKIDDNDPTGLSLEEAVAKIRGAKGTQVKLTVSRNNGTPFDITITRDTINVASVKWSMKNGNVGYIQVVRFGPDTGAKVDQAAGELGSQGAKKFVLDVRDDPGGYLDQAVTVASEFIDSKLVVEERRGSTSVDKLTATSGGKLVGLPLVVLINGGSASASEIVAGALHDNGAAKLVGEKSFGKGSVQEITQLGGGASLKVTVAHWYTPNGVNINKEGIKPDIEVKQTKEDFDAGRDPQLDKALALLK